MKFIKTFNYRKILTFLWQQEGSPFYNAKGVAVGVFSGCFPFFGFQTLLGIFLAQIIKGNLVLSAISTWISNPFTYIPLYFFNYKVGVFLLNSKSQMDFDPNLLKDEFWNQGWFFTSRLILGSSLVGLFFGILFGYITYFFYKNKLSK